MVDLETVEEEEKVLEELHRSDHDSHGMVDVRSDMTRHDAERLAQLIRNHARYTGSTRAQHILDNWEAFLPKFVKVMPVEYRRALKEMQAETGELTMDLGRA